MATTTTTYGFATPTAGTEDNTWGALLNANFDELDDLLDGTDQIECIRLKSAAMAADALDPDDGNIQTRTLSANTTFTDSLADGDQILAAHQRRQHIYRHMAHNHMARRRRALP